MLLYDVTWYYSCVLCFVLRTYHTYTAVYPTCWTKNEGALSPVCVRGVWRSALRDVALHVAEGIFCKKINQQRSRSVAIMNRATPRCTAARRCDCRWMQIPMYIALCLFMYDLFEALVCDRSKRQPNKYASMNAHTLILAQLMNDRFSFRRHNHHHRHYHDVRS